MTKDKGTFCISFDLELFWGRPFHQIPEFIKSAEKEREIINTLLDLSVKYKVPYTWATVGHLFLEKCSRVSGEVHTDVLRPNYTWLKGDWFQNDPASNLRQDPLWYGKDIIDKIRKADNQEIGCHTFSHMIALEGCSKRAFVSEIKKCIEYASKVNIELKSFVFPRNKIKYLDVLKNNGFIAYRGLEPFSKFPLFFKKLISAIELFLPIAFNIRRPEIRNGLVCIPSSMYFVSARGIRKFIPGGIRTMKAKNGINNAIKNKAIFSLWMHPGDFADDTAKLMKEFEDILIYAKRMQNRGLLTIKTMGEISHKTLNSDWYKNED